MHMITVMKQKIIMSTNILWNRKVLSVNVNMVQKNRHVAIMQREKSSPLCWMGEWKDDFSKCTILGAYFIKLVT